MCLCVIGGSGFGLVIVKYVVVNYDGIICVWSKLGIGLMFILVFLVLIEVYYDDE